MAIIDALRQVGASVVFIEHPVDLLVGYHGTTHLIEVKTQTGKLTPAQHDFVDRWRGRRVVIARSVDEALSAVGAV